MTTDTLAISTHQLSKLYGGAYSLKNLDLDIKSGEVFGFLGHNGAGKTTTVNILTTLLKSSSGSAEIFGHNIITDSVAARQLFGYLPENVRFYDTMTAYENVEYLARLSGITHPKERILEVFDYLNLTEYKDKRVGTFSKGMRQRVGIAQAIIHKPKLLFLDEPTSGLDPQGIKQLRDLIIKLNKEKKMTIFMNTHLLSEVAKTCTSIGVLNHGQLIYQDTLSRTMERFPNEQSLESIYTTVDSHRNE